MNIGTYLDRSMPQYPKGCCITGRGQQQWQKGECSWTDGTCLGKSGLGKHGYSCAMKTLPECPTYWYEAYNY